MFTSFTAKTLLMTWNSTLILCNDQSSSAPILGSDELDISYSKSCLVRTPSTAKCHLVIVLLQINFAGPSSMLYFISYLGYSEIDT